MTREEAIKILEEVKELDDSMYQFNPAYMEALNMAIQALEQEPVLDKIRVDIQKLRNCSCTNSDGIIDDVEDIIDKYKSESEEKE